MPEEQVKQLQPPAQRPCARIVVKDVLYHQVAGEQPTMFDLPGFTRQLKSDEQVYHRKLTVGEDWQSIDVGWLHGCCGMLILENLEGRFIQVQPTDNERSCVEARVVDVRFGEEVGVVLLPRESVRFQPFDVSKVFMRCRLSTARVSINVVPG